MRIVMDSDCLIKLAKARMKEEVCRAYAVTIPAEVRREVVDQAAAHPESTVVKRNLESGVLAEAAEEARAGKGEDGALRLFRQGGYDAIATDDKRFVRKLRVLDVPYLTPGTLVFLMARDAHLSVTEAVARLHALSPLISEDEVAVVTLKLETLGGGR